MRLLESVKSVVPRRVTLYRSPAVQVRIKQGDAAHNKEGAHKVLWHKDHDEVKEAREAEGEEEEERGARSEERP